MTLCRCQLHNLKIYVIKEMRMFRAFSIPVVFLLLLSAVAAVFTIHCGDILHAASGQQSCGVALLSHDVYHLNLLAVALSAVLFFATWTAAFLRLVSSRLVLQPPRFSQARESSRVRKSAPIPLSLLSYAFAHGIIERKEAPVQLYCSQ